MYTPRTLIEVLVFRILPLTAKDASRLNFFGFFARCISSYLCGANTELWRAAHRSQSLCIFSSVLQFSSVDFPYASILTSSTKPMPAALVPGLLQISSKSAL